MSDLGNKKIMANNIKRYMKKNNVTQSDICNALNFKPSTFSDWVNAKTYPRIDKIEMLANYFNIEKSDLVEKEKKDNSNRIWENVKHLRKKNNISREELAKLLDVSTELISEIEENKKIPDYELIVKLAKILNCKVSYLLQGEELGKYNMSIIDQIDKIMTDDDMTRKKVIEAAVNFNDEDISLLGKIIDALSTKKAD